MATVLAEKMFRNRNSSLAKEQTIQQSFCVITVLP